MTDARQRLVFIDDATGKEYGWQQNNRGKVLSVVYLGQHVGKLTDYGSGFPYWHFDEDWPGEHTHHHHLTAMRTHLLRYFDAKFARMAITRGVS